MKQSAGLLLYRFSAGALEILLGHMGGPFWAKKDAGAWTIFKGEYDAAAETPMQAAIREFREETGMEPRGDFIRLGTVKTGGKEITAWAFEGSFDPCRLKSSSFSIEWPPRSGIIRQYPEIDRAQWFHPGPARAIIVKTQAPFIEQLCRKLQQDS